MCLAQGPQSSDAGEAQPAALRSRVKHSTTEPLRSQFVCVFDREFVCEGQEVSVLERER